MDHRQFKFAHGMYPMCDDDDEIVSNSVEEMLMTHDDDAIHTPTLPYSIDKTMAIDEDLLSSSSPMSSDRFSNSLQDELESLANSSQPQTPCESFISSNDYTNPLSQMLKDSSSFSDDMVDDSNASVRPVCFNCNYDTSALMYGNDDMTTFSGIVNCNDVLKTDKSKETVSDNTIVCCYRNFTPDEKPSSPSSSHVQADENYFSAQEQSPEENKRGKISGLQRHALDLIFAVTDRPSRGLVLHMAGELGLHHITVKNFFSNGRRRLRRAAARLNDPERTRRENQRRKEKRRLAAIAAMMPNGDRIPISKAVDGSEPPREPAPVLSPERRALMEKLAFKVQRSVAQKAAQPTFKEVASSSNVETLSPQTHSSIVLLAKSLNSSNTASTKTTVSYLSSNEDELVSMLAYSADQDLQHSQQEAIAFTTSQNDTYISLSEDHSFVSLNQEEQGPYSPTSWQSLLNV